MIRINLAKAGRKQKSQAAAGGGFEGFSGGVSEIQRQGALRLVIIFLFPLALYLYEFQLIPDLQSTLASKQKVLQSLTQKNEQAKGAVEEIKKFKEDQEKLQKQIDTLEGLRKERLKEVKMMDNLQKDIPEKVWLTKIDFQETKLALAGLATSDAELTQFMENLSRSVFLHDVNLVRSEEQSTDKGMLKKFDISCAVNQLSPGASPEVKK